MGFVELINVGTQRGRQAAAPLPRRFDVDSLAYDVPRYLALGAVAQGPESRSCEGFGRDAVVPVVNACPGCSAPLRRGGHRVIPVQQGQHVRLAWQACLPWGEFAHLPSPGGAQGRWAGALMNQQANDAAGRKCRQHSAPTAQISWPCQFYPRFQLCS